MTNLSLIDMTDCRSMDAAVAGLRLPAATAAGGVLLNSLLQIL